MDLHLKDATVLVTGSSAGIGQAAAVAFGAEGARVAVTYHKHREGAEKTANKIQEAGGQALVAHYDLADPDSIRASIEQIQKEWGTLNVLVNNAAPMDVAGPTGQLFEDVPFENNVSSDGTDGWPGLGPYATAKSGLHGLTRTLAPELGPANILSNVVMPGAVMTERTAKNMPDEQKEQLRQHLPTRQLITPEDVAAVIVFLGSPVNKQIIGEIIRVTGGR